MATVIRRVMFQTLTSPVSGSVTVTGSSQVFLIGYFAALAIYLAVSLILHATILLLSLTGFGNFPVLTPAYHVERETGIIAGMLFFRLLRVH